jgi:hypothetical protein
MFKVLCKLIVMQPQLLLTHAQNYGYLLVEGWQQAVASWKTRMLLYCLSAISLLLGLAGGVGALMLWAALPVLNPDNAWVLVALPLTLLVASALLYKAAQRCQLASLFDDVQAQLALDMLALDQAKSR